MAFLNETISLESLPEDDNNFKTIPASWYNVFIHSAELRATKSGTGQYIAMRYDITGPTQQGRVIFGNLNIRNTSAVAEEIGRKQLGALMRAIGIGQLSDTDQLVGHHLQIKVTRKQDESEYADDDGYINDISAYKAIAGAAPAPSSAATSSKEASAPWRKAKPAPAQTESPEPEQDMDTPF